MYRLQGQSYNQHRKDLQMHELPWIMKLQTANLLGLNDSIMGIGTLSRTSIVNAMKIISRNNRRKRSHGRRINQH